MTEPQVTIEISKMDNEGYYSVSFQGHPETEVGCYGGVYEGIGEFILQHGKEFGVKVVDLRYLEEH